MFGLFGKKHSVSISHVKYKTLATIFIMPDNDSLKSFLSEYYHLENFKITVNLSSSKLNIVEAAEIYNLNPYLQNINVNDIVVEDVNDLLSQYNINSYQKEFVSISNIFDYDADFVIFVTNPNKESGEISTTECHFPSFELMKKHMNMLHNAGIVYTYTVNPNVITVKEYLALLNFRNKFNVKENFKTAMDISQFIIDGRVLSGVELKIKEKKEIT